MKQVVVAGGGITVVDVPAPTVEPGFVVVRTARTAISPGTETSSGAAGGGNVVVRAARNPDLVKKVIDRARQQGVRDTADLVRSRLSAMRPTGYSAAGSVVAVGEGVPELHAGDRVACAGAGYANHAEYILVPRLLCARIPEGVDYDAAAFATLGAIAMQGVRQLAPSLGDTVVVVGLGIVGQLTAQLAAADGCRVIAADTAADRVARAESCIPRCIGVNVSTSKLAEAVLDLTHGRGADGALLTAATRSSEPINEAMAYCRERGRVVVVGDVGLQVRRKDFYMKEIDVRISRSYGPGRYDPEYEEGGVDYPYGYVRWTEQRNLECFLDLVAAGRVQIAPLVDLRMPVEAAPEAYRQITENRAIIGALLEYPEVSDGVGGGGQGAPAVVQLGGALSRNGHVNVALIGAGAFARAVHIPNLRRDDRVRIVGVAARTGITASTVARDCGAALATTDWREVLGEHADAVVVATRHDVHAEQAIAALQAGRHVFVEKPLALSVADCERVVAAQHVAGRVVMIGFNRRFAPAVVHARSALARMRGPRNVLIRVNAGRLPANHWTYGPEGGGRVLGEGCHFFDLARFLVGAEPASVLALNTRGGASTAEDRDNLDTVIRYSDGSVATIVYATTGFAGTGKELIEIYADGGSVIIDDYKSCEVGGVPGITSQRFKGMDKGHRGLMAHFVASVAGAEKPGMDARDGLAAQACAEAALRSASSGDAVSLS
jgi:predicted dehydrogenase/threonine dehydrogenase-like Zn-dependent dehydrogenase